MFGIADIIFNMQNRNFNMTTPVIIDQSCLNNSSVLMNPIDSVQMSQKVVMESYENLLKTL